MATKLQRTDDDLDVNWKIDKTFHDFSSDGEDIDNVELDSNEKNSENLEAAKKKRKKDKFEKLKKKSFAIQDSKWENIGVEDPNNQATTLWNHYLSTAGHQLTDLQKENSLKGKHISTVRSMKERNGAKISEFIMQLIPNWKRDLKRNTSSAFGSPVVLIICSSAIRSVEILKELRDFRTHVAKLFSKHMKIEEQVTALEKFYSLGVGTPHRLKALLDIGALNMENTKHIILDMHKDSKNYNIFQLTDTSKDIMELFHLYLKQIILQGNTKIAFF